MVSQVCQLVYFCHVTHFVAMGHLLNIVTYRCDSPNSSHTLLHTSSHCWGR
ncbi:hypothetical protein NEOLEDRAFT_1184832 [Neolentinus lepideus HHB14362 ss-1]|uniref:Uncharacterized protein n=1 Tax=Neolentinus lepideus HHB14362 ss-1 TaxID=1314782 RepID=A0A165M560_9AGAM|nr:hypothetical protein NEOLEDRAFT_1184832 [Neolentinus lepideus HHB14362 ss-1]